MGRRIDSYKYRIAEDEIELKDEKGFRTFWRKHVTSLNKRDRELRDAINWGAVAPQRFTVAAYGEAEPAYAIGWRKYPSAGFIGATFWKSRDEVVFVSGLVQRTSGIGQVIFTLPVGYRPLGGHIFNAYGSSTTACRLDVFADGRVYFFFGGDPSQFLSLAGINFPAEEI